MSDAHKAEVRQRILEAAIRVFERTGFARASMNAIAAEARLSAGGLYTHFASKEELFLAAFAAVVADDERALEKGIAQSPVTADAIDLAIDFVAGVAAPTSEQGIRAAGGTFLLHAWATADENPALRELLVARREGAVGLSRSVIERAMARGELPRDLDAEGLARAFTSMLDGLFLQRAEQGQAFTADQARRQALALVGIVFHAAAAGDRS